MTPNDKAKPREWWIEQFNGRKVPTFSAYVEKPRFSPIILKVDDEKTIPAYAYFHVIEYSAVTALQAENESLKQEIERLKEYEWKYNDLCK